MCAVSRYHHKSHRRYYLRKPKPLQEAKNSAVQNMKVFINLLVPNQQTGAIIGKGKASFRLWFD